MKQKLIALLALLLTLSTVSAQQNTQLRGKVVDSVTGDPLGEIRVALDDSQTEITDERGEFHFTSVAPGKHMLTFSAAQIMTRYLQVEVGTDLVTLLKDVQVIVTRQTDHIPLIDVIEESMLDDDIEGSSQEVSSMVILSNDVYLNQVGYQLQPFRFKVRGYDSYHEQKFINGVRFNDQLRGVFNFASIGALNDLTRNGDVDNYFQPGTFTFGSIGGSENINMRAGSYARGGKATVSYTNRNYYLRGMASYSSGLSDEGWAFTIGVGARYSDEGNIPGTFYRNFSYAIGLEKQWQGGVHSLSFTTFGSPVERGQQGASYQEAYDLTGNNLYNPNWGYQNGKKRNSRVVTAFDPTAILSYIWKINDNTTLSSGLGGHYSRYGGTALNWYDGSDPRPDYYRYLPSYYTDNEYAYNHYVKLWQQKDPEVTQVNWDRLWQVNELNRQVDNGAAIYMVEERRSDLFEGTFHTVLNSQIAPNMKLTAGAEIRLTQSLQFKTVNDLLGAEYVLDYDKFAERDYAGDTEIVQNDLNKPDRKAYKDDMFGYDFRLNINSGNIWIQNQYTSHRMDVYYGTRLSYTEFYRTGKMRNGRYPDSSYGKGEKHTFIDYALKAGLNYKIDGRNFLTVNASFQIEAPLANNAYVSPRITDHSIPDLESGRILSADVNYIFSYPSLSGRVSVFRTNFYNQVARKSYYYDTYRTYMNHLLSKMNKVNQGIEIGLKYKLNNNWSFDLAGTLSEYYYSNNPEGVMSFENASQEDIYEKVYMKNYYVGSAPQVAGTLGINYFYNYWFLGAHANFAARNYIDIAPIRRLDSNYQITPEFAGVNPNLPDDMETFRTLVDQERYGSAYTIDLSIGKMIFLRNRNSVNFNFSVNNILNRKNIKTGGYEQGRIDLSYPDRFQSKYYYMQGINCFLNASYRF